MRAVVYLFALSLIVASAATQAQETEFNKTPHATCQRKDSFDEYVYHAPKIPGIVTDGDPSDWQQYPLLEWAAIDHWCEGTGQQTWPDWNDLPTGPDDLSARFKVGWGLVNDWPVLYLLVEWIDDDFQFDPEAPWDRSDVLQFWLGETLYDRDVPIPRHHLAEGQERQFHVYGVPGWGIRMRDHDGEFLLDTENQPYTLGDFCQVTEMRGCLECQVQLFQDYQQGTPWEVVPGASCLALGISGLCDYDSYDGSFTYLTWGLSNRHPPAGDDARVKHSTIGFESSYDELFDTSSGAQSEISVSRDEYDFGEVEFGTTSICTLTVQNLGQGYLAVYGTDVSDDRFTAYPSSFALNPEENAYLTVEFLASAAGDAEATLTIRSNDPDNPVLEVWLTAQVPPKPPTISVSHSDHDFGDVLVDVQRGWSFLAHNGGTFPLLVYDVSSSDPQFAASPVSFGVAVGEAQQVVVTFNPSHDGQQQCVLTILSNDPDQPTLQITLSGNGVLQVATEIGFNETQNATCRRTDPFDAYIYHAPRLSGIVTDGNPSDWQQYPLLGWAPIDHWCEGTSQGTWPDWNDPPTGPDDLSGRFKAGWGLVNDWPVLYLLIEWIDDDFHFGPEAGWNVTDALQFCFSETLYNYDIPIPHPDLPEGQDRQFEVYGVPGWGIRMRGRDGGLFLDTENQPYTIGDFWQETGTRGCLECQMQLFQDYEQGTPWEVVPGASCLALGISGLCDYDSYDGSFTYLTWGLSNRDPSSVEDARVKHSTIGFERPYEEMFGESPLAAPQVSLAASDHDFGEVEMGSSSTWSFSVTNEGNLADATVKVCSHDSQFEPSPSFFAVKPGASQDVTITFCPASAGDQCVALRIETNDPFQPTSEILMTGTAGSACAASSAANLTDEAGQSRKGELPSGYSIELAAYPNPFNSSVLIAYRASNGNTRIWVFDLLGQAVARLLGSNQSPGYHTLRWDGTDAAGRPLPSGMYVCVLRSGGLRATERLVILR